MYLLFYFFISVNGCDPGWKSYVFDGPRTCLLPLTEKIPLRKAESLCEKINSLLPIIASDQKKEGTGMKSSLV